MDRIVLDMCPEQASAVRDALDLYTRIMLGQFDEIGNIARMGMLALHVREGDKTLPGIDTLDELDAVLKAAKAVMGHPANGSHGIGHKHVHVSGKRAYEALKALDRTLAVRRDPNPEFKGVNYDGLIVRYTSDPAPEARVETRTAA